MQQGIAERKEYHREIDAEWERRRAPLSVFVAVFWGAGMFLAGLLVAWIGGWLGAAEARLMAVLCGCGSIAVGALSYRWGWDHGRGKQIRFIDRLYDGDARLVAPPPPEDEYPLRLVCAMVLSPRYSLGGVLYLGPAGFLFLPNVNNPAPLDQAVRIQPPGTIVVNRVGVHVPRRPLWLLGTQAIELLLISGGRAAARCSAPRSPRRRSGASSRTCAAGSSIRPPRRRPDEGSSSRTAPRCVGDPAKDLARRAAEEQGRASSLLLCCSA